MLLPLLPPLPKRARGVLDGTFPLLRRDSIVWRREQEERENGREGEGERGRWEGRVFFSGHKQLVCLPGLSPRPPLPPLRLVHLIAQEQALPPVAGVAAGAACTGMSPLPGTPSQGQTSCVSSLSSPLHHVGSEHTPDSRSELGGVSVSAGRDCSLNIDSSDEEEEGKEEENDDFDTEISDIEVNLPSLLGHFVHCFHYTIIQYNMMLYDGFYFPAESSTCLMVALFFCVFAAGRSFWFGGIGAKFEEIF
jgi:hypothetical protein